MHRGTHAAHGSLLRVRCASAAGEPAASAAVAAAAGDSSSRMDEPSTALLLAWYACGNRSLFAAQCMVEAAVELYREGRSFEELQLIIKLAAAQGRAPTEGGAEDGAAAGEGQGAGEAASQGPARPMLLPQDEDVLSSWVALVFLTLEELGVPRDKEPLGAAGSRGGGGGGAGSLSGGLGVGAVGGGAGAGVGAGGSGGGVSGSSSAYLRGMLGYVRQTLGMYDEGQTLARVAGLQGLVQQSAGPGGSAFLVLMQQYTRLVLLTVEVVAACGLSTTRPLRPPETVLQPSGYGAAFASSCSVPADMLPDAPPSGAGAAAAGGAAGSCPPRGLAVRLLMAFMGAVLGCGWSLDKFAETVRVAYSQGLAADELFSELDEQEFVQSGGLLPVASSPAAATDLDGRPLDQPPAAAAAGTAEGAGGAGAPAAASAAAGGSGSSRSGSGEEITKALLSAWISISYMSLAQLQVANPAAERKLGWAWAGVGDLTEAFGMNDFVANTLRQLSGTGPRTLPAAPEAAAAAAAGPPGAAPPAAAAAGSAAAAEGQAAAGSEAARVAEEVEGMMVSGGGAAAAAGGAGGAARRPRGQPKVPLVRLEDDVLPSTSTAFRVLTQQVNLVRAIFRDVVRSGQE